MLNRFYRAMLCIRGTIAMGLCPCLSVCLSVCFCLSLVGVLLKRLNTGSHKTTPHDSPGTVVFRCQRSPRNSTGITRYGGAECRWSGSKSVTSDKKPAISRKQYKIDAWFLLKLNRKSYALYRMVTLPMTLCVP